MIRVLVADALTRADPSPRGKRRGVDGDLDPAGAWFTLMLSGA
jgi:hypothetical protein